MHLERYMQIYDVANSIKMMAIKEQHGTLCALYDIHYMHHDIIKVIMTLKLLVAYIFTNTLRKEN